MSEKLTEITDERLDRRCNAMKCAALTLFTEQGFEATKLSEVVERAGGSLATLYKLFGNKEGLLEAVISDTRDHGADIIREIAARGGKPSVTLHEVGLALHESVLSPEYIAIFRIVMSRCIADSSFAEDFFKKTQLGKRVALHDIFQLWAEQGVEMIEEPTMLADIFLGMHVLDFQMEAISHGHFEPATPEQIRRRTDFFLRGAGLAD
ncbi:TetR/AcrR family transcriptional regulator [Croceicoccus mobilis]|uniref:Transcriptional regulator n=1 Tax=Croceicoccus mobilis TaxID=1703339 RepID=A0A916Z3I4_9SPHN|nr:TetR/AcrR family transcriptional regulator [Croceicoccus mobilis]GGD74333.1 transcriptional regulator [Croceicoccus mobilis]